MSRIAIDLGWKMSELKLGEPRFGEAEISGRAGGCREDTVAKRNPPTSACERTENGKRLHRMGGVIGAFGLVMGPLAGQAFAQQDPASRVLQQTEDRARELQQEGLGEQQGPAVIAPPATRAELPPPGGPTVMVNSVNFGDGSAFLTDKELLAITVKYVGRRLDFRGIFSLIRDVNDLYEEKGIVTAAAILPPQDITDGSLDVRLVEGKLGNIALVGEHETNNEYVLNRVTLTRNGVVVDVPAAARDIAYFNNTNRAQLRLLLQPGAAFGLTDLALGISEPPTDYLEIFLDNQGVDSTGPYEGGITYQKYGLLGMDDNLLLHMTGTEGSIAGTASYDIPVTRSGTRLGASYTISSIKVIDGPTKDLNITGRSQAVTGTISQPLVANDTWTVLGVGSASMVYSDSWSGDVPLVNMDIAKGVFGTSVSYSNDRVSVSVQPQVVYAHAIDHVSSSNEDFVLGTLSANGFVKLPHDSSLVLHGVGQYSASDLLPGNLLFNIGGPTSVRGYPADGVAGDSGYYAQVELHHDMSRFREGLDIFAFTDAGQVFSTFPETTTLVSAGAGLAYDMGKGNLELTLAAPILKSISDQADLTVYGRLTFKTY